MRRLLPAVLVTATLTALVVAPAAANTVDTAAGTAAQAAGSTYTTVTPARVLDTRSGAPVGPDATITLDLSDRVPAGTTAVVMNVTAVGPTAGTFVTVFPHGVPQPTVSQLNVVSRETRASLVTVAVGADRSVDLYNNSGSTHLLADLSGYYSTGAGALFTSRDPARVLSTRIGAGATATLDLTADVPASATAVVLNVTATGPTANTFVVAWPHGTTRPATSTVNLAPGATNANLTPVALGAGRRVSLYNSAGTVDVHLDLAGFYTPQFGAVFTPVTPRRVFDTRNGIGTFDGRIAPIGAAQEVSLRADVLPDEAVAAVLTFTATQATAPTFLSVRQSFNVYYPPETSTLNSTPNRSVSNLAVVVTKYEHGMGRTYVYNRQGSTHAIADLAGYFTIPEVPCTANCLYTWGGNWGGLGVGTNTSEVTTPRPMPGLTDVTAVSGRYALRADGTVWAWGTNGQGDLGAGWLGGESPIPVRVAGLTNVTQVAASGSGAVALRADGTVWAWGGALLGNPNVWLASTPVRVPGLTGVRSIVVSYTTAYALLANGSVMAWGENRFGKLGTGSTAEVVQSPTPVVGLTAITQLSGNYSNAYARRDDGTAWAWGSNTSGQLGNNSTAALSRVPVQVSGLTGVTTVHAGNTSAVGAGETYTGVAHAIGADGGVWSWGQNAAGELGADSTAAFSRVPLRVVGLTGVTRLSAGATIYALRSDGTVWAWGDASIDALGIPASSPARKPVQVPIPATVVDLHHSRALDSAGNVWTWGYNGSGERGIGHSWQVPAAPTRAHISGVTALLAGLALRP